MQSLQQLSLRKYLCIDKIMESATPSTPGSVNTQRYRVAVTTRKPFVCILSILSYMHVIYENILQYRVSHNKKFSKTVGLLEIRPYHICMDDFTAFESHA